jgi:putative glutamine amidotransferase
MTSPLIGITTTHVKNQSPLPISGVSEAYVRSVRSAGGIPLLIPSGLEGDDLDALRQRLDGILFTGGGDIDPGYFNGRPHERVYGIIPERDQTEVCLVRLAAESGMPFFGICRGIQVINVALGGTLYTDIATQFQSQLKHDNEKYDLLAHTVDVQPTARLAQIVGKTSILTNSLHHQAVELLAPPLTAVAWASDGLVEGVELTGHPFGLAVQWHPEWMQNIEEMRNLFQEFVEACKKER